MIKLKDTISFETLEQVGFIKVETPSESYYESDGLRIDCTTREITIDGDADEYYAYDGYFLMLELGWVEIV